MFGDLLISACALYSIAAVLEYQASLCQSHVLRRLLSRRASLSDQLWISHVDVGALIVECGHRRGLVTRFGCLSRRLEASPRLVVSCPSPLV